MPKRRFISYLRAHGLFSKRCLYHQVWVKDFNSKGSFFLSIPAISKFPKYFLNDLTRIPPDREIDFGIHLLLDSHPISIPPYKMALVELMELKEKLKDLLDKCFISPSVSL